MLDETAQRANPKAAFDPSGGDVLEFALAERAAGRSAAIVTLAAIEGSAPRELGAQMAVAEDGRFTGSISSGCLERAIVEEARAAMTRGHGGIVRYGKGSKFADVILPCGSGVDLLFTVNPPVEILRAAFEAREARSLHTVSFFADSAAISQAQAGWRASAFTRVYQPALKIVAAGVGAELVVLSRIADAAGYAVCAVSPDSGALEQCTAGDKVRLQSVSSAPDIKADPWTAFVFLFHDREWEAMLIPAALASSAFYIGAVGSRRTHAARLEVLQAHGLSEAALARLDGPIGLIPATRDPSALAVSVLAGVLAAWPRAPR